MFSFYTLWSQLSCQLSHRENLPMHRMWEVLRLTEAPQESKHMKSFGYKSDFDQHNLIHTEVKPFPCSECGKQFRWKHPFHNHQLIHIGEKTYDCSECEKSFRKKSDLKALLRLHIGGRSPAWVQWGRNYINDREFHKEPSLYLGWDNLELTDGNDLCLYSDWESYWDTWDWHICNQEYHLLSHHQWTSLGSFTMGVRASIRLTDWSDEENPHLYLSLLLRAWAGIRVKPDVE